jgi:hypothetical protein
LAVLAAVDATDLVSVRQARGGPLPGDSFLGNPLILWPALAALGVCLRDWIAGRRADAFLILAFSSAHGWRGRTAANHRLYLLLPAIGNDRDAGFGLCLYAGRAGAAAMDAVGVRRGGSTRFAAMLPISVASLGTLDETYRRLMIFQSWI